MSIPPLPFKVKTKVSWAGEEEGDLGFIENEVIEVYSIVDDSWWSGKLRRNRAEGIFPKDYVKILEDPSLGNSLSNTPSKQNTPTKDIDFRTTNKNTTPLKSNGYRSSKLLPKKHFPKDSYDEFSFDNSYEDLEKFNRSNRKKYSKPIDEFLAKQNEIEKFKILQQQQNYHIKKAAELDRQKRFLQQDFGRNSIGNFPDSPTNRAKFYNSGAKFAPNSMHFDQGHRQMSSPNFKDHKNDFGNSQLQFHLFNNNTVESFSPETSPKQNKRSGAHPYRGHNIDASPAGDLEEIAMKKKQLELELLQLEELQRSTLQMRRGQNFNKAPANATVSPTSKFMENSNDSYVSEDLASSKKNYQSKENLSKKLSRYATDDEINVYEYDDGYQSDSNSPSPPPPPKHCTPVQNMEAFDMGYRDDDDENVDNDYDLQVIDEIPHQNKGRDHPLQLQNKIPYDADDFKFSGNGNKVILTEEEFLRLSQVQQEELRNSIKSLQSDVLNLSELSATSAGSFLRHRYEKEYQAEQEMRMKNLSLNDSRPTELNGESQDQDSKHLMDSIFQDKKSRHPNIFKKLLKKKDDIGVNPLELRMQEQDQDKEIDWTTFKKELNRANTLTSLDKQLRTKRVVREEATMIVKPFDYLTEINTNETISDDYETLEFSKGKFDKMDQFAARYPTDSDLNVLISDIGIKFTNKVSQLRCVLHHFVKFHIIEENGKIQQLKPRLNELLMSGEGSIYQLNYLFKKVLDALRIPSEIVLGFWKKPNEFYHDDQFIINHCWLSVLVENQFLIIDLLNFKKPSICNVRDGKYNEFYFLAKPLTLVSTHVPSIIDLQHVIPPLDQNIAFHLPRLYSGYHKNRLNFKNFNNALTRLKDLEFFEMDLEVPIDVELFTLVKTGKVTSNEFSLCQIYWSNNKRYAKIKAVLPESEKIGVLQIFAGEKGLQKHFNNIHELSVVIPLQHEGEYKPIKFVPRYPTVQSQSNDLYVKSPQTNQILIKNSYNFSILQFPSCGISNATKLLNPDFKLVIESPSGKYLKLEKTEPGKPYGSYECLIKTQELGLYRGLVIGDSGNSWYVFAQWECTSGTVT